MLLPEYVSAKGVDPHLIVNAFQEMIQKSKTSSQKNFLNCKWVDSNTFGDRQARKCNNDEKCLDINILEKCVGFVICEKAIKKPSQNNDVPNDLNSEKKYYIRCSRKNNSNCDATKCFEKREQ